MNTDELISQYKIKRFLSSSDKDFVAALSVYNHIVPAEIKTSTNEITKFIDKTDNSKRIMFFFGLYKDKEVVGYVECAYLLNTKSLVIDYFILNEDNVYNSVFYPLYILLTQYFENNGMDITYKVVEIAIQSEDIVNAESRYLRTLLQAENFKIIPAIYYQPKLGDKNTESNFEMRLMIASAGKINNLKSETYLEIVKDIYFNHYLDWYHNFMSDEEFSNYEKHINSLMKKIENLHLEETLTLKDINNTCKYYDSTQCVCTDSLNTAGHPTSNNSSNKSKRFMLPFFIIIMVIISIIITVIMDALNINSETATKILVSLCTVVASWVSSRITKNI